MTHPHGVFGGNVAEQRRVDAVGPPERGPAVLAPLVAADGAAELVSEKLRAVTDAEDGNVEVVDGGIETGCALDMDALGAPGEDQRGRSLLDQFGGRDAMRNDLGVDVQLTDPPSDQLRILGAEVDDVHNLVGMADATGDWAISHG